MSDAREKLQQNVHDQVQRSYEQHQIFEESEGRWLLRRHSSNRWDGHMWTEIICLAHGGIFVDGDIDPVVFRYGPKDPIERIHWMGQRKNAWDSYLREKATIGMGGLGFGSCLEEWVSDIAREDVEEEIEQIIDGRDVRDLSPETVKMIDALRDDVIDMLRDDDTTQESFCRELYRVLDDAEGVGRYGVVPSHRMFTAHAALARLSKLLKEREFMSEEDSKGGG